MNINTNTYLEFFSYFIAVQSALMPKRYRLTPKEQWYLAECAAYHCQGGNLHDFEEAANYLMARGVVSSFQECSVYKNRLSIKKWIDTGRGRFRLPASLTKASDYDLHIRYIGVPDSESIKQAHAGGPDGASISAARRRILHSLDGGTIGAVVEEA